MLKMICFKLYRNILLYLGSKSFVVRNVNIVVVETEIFTI